MKKIFYACSFLLTAIAANAQDFYTSNGTLSSARTVTMNGNSLNFVPSGFGSSRFFINGTTGSIGIGTTTPAEKLSIIGNLQATSGIFTNGLANGQTFSSFADRNLKCSSLTAGALIDAATKSRTFNYFDFPQSNLDDAATVHLTIEDRSYNTRLRFFAKQGKESQFILSDKQQVQNFSVNDDGNENITVLMPKANSKLGIGTTNFTDGFDTYSLSVNGNIRAKRVKVYTTWADYVFEENYNLPTLQQVEDYIKAHGHLQDIPSAKDVEEKGIELGEMNKLLLQKIEELTLYTIELNKKVEELQNKLQKQ